MTENTATQTRYLRQIAAADSVRFAGWDLAPEDAGTYDVWTRTPDGSRVEWVDHLDTTDLDEALRQLGAEIVADVDGSEAPYVRTWEIR